MASEKGRSGYFSGLSLMSAFPMFFEGEMGIDETPIEEISREEDWEEE
jgi:hypothetical protein